MSTARTIFATFGLFMLTAGTIGVAGGAVAGVGCIALGMFYIWLAVRRP